MLPLCQMLQGNPAGVIFVNIIDDPADALSDHRIVAFKIYNDLILKSKQIKMLVQIFNNPYHLINAGGLVMKAFLRIINEGPQQHFPQGVQLPVKVFSSKSVAEWENIG